MEELFDDLVGFLMTEEEELVHANTVADHITMPTGIISSFNDGTDDCQDQLEEADWYTQYPDQQYPDHLGHEELMMYNINHPSNGIQPDNLLLTDVNGSFQENDGLIDQYIHDETTSLLQQQSVDNNCQDGHDQTPSSLPNLLIDAIAKGCFQENDGFIDQYIHDETTWPLQQRAADNSHQTQSSTSLLPAAVPHNNVELLINLPDSSTSEKQLSRVQEIQERPTALLLPVGEPVVKQAKRRKKGKQVVRVNHVEEEEDDALGDFLKDLVIDNEDTNIGDGTQPSSVLSKNLISERMRRKRLNKQLLTLRGMVPNITKMDKRSVLVDALAYLEHILHQTKIEMENQNNISTTADDPATSTENTCGNIAGSPTSPIDVETDHLPCPHLGVVSDKSLVNANAGDQPQEIMMPLISPNNALFPAITMMEADKVDEERYLLKIVYTKALGAMAHVQRSVEMLKGIEFIDVSISEYDQHHMQSTTFLRVKKIKGSILVTDAENLLHKVKTIANRLGVRFPRVASTAGQ